MKKMDNKGFMLAETLIVTIFVAGVLIFIFIQFTNLSQKYIESYKNNTIEGIYALDDIKTYIEEDTELFDYISNTLLTKDYINLTNCSFSSNKKYCTKLLEVEQIDQLIILNNQTNYANISGLSDEILEFIDKISNEGNEKYRLVAKFKNSTFATIRFGV